jgi:hypothetical protein
MKQSPAIQCFDAEEIKNNVSFPFLRESGSLKASKEGEVNDFIVMNCFQNKCHYTKLIATRHSFSALALIGQVTSTSMNAN